jgi:regulator of protease activity HflC (stomatin/prohibitin superfamily)
MAAGSGIQFLIWLVVMFIGGVFAYGAYTTLGEIPGAAIAVLTFVLAGIISSAVRITNQWQRAIVLHLGTFSGVRGPGLFFVTPILQSVAYVIDTRMITTPFNAEQTITADTVPVDVDAVLFWRVIGPEHAALEVENYQQAVGWAAQTALRDVIGRSTLATILSERPTIDKHLRNIIDQRTEPWGIRVDSVEIRDVKIPAELQAAMSRQAQAERERQARIILGDSEMQIAEKFNEAAKLYADNPTALHLRAMNMLYEGLKERGALMIVPSSALDSMGLGTVAGLAALRKEAEQQGGFTTADGKT